MILKITQSDIDAGVKSNCLQCPIALAFERATGLTCSVGPYITETLSGKRWIMPHKAFDFIYNFDNGIKVVPIKFEICF